MIADDSNFIYLQGAFNSSDEDVPVGDKGKKAANGSNGAAGFRSYTPAELEDETVKEIGEVCAVLGVQVGCARVSVCIVSYVVM